VSSVFGAVSAVAAAGFTVAGVDRSEQGLKELPDSIQREAADPTDPAAARSVLDRIATEVGPPDVLVNTIGAACAVSKAAPVHLTRVLDLELRPLGSGNAVAPQLIDTAKTVPTSRRTWRTRSRRRRSPTSSFTS
jgi:NAD(P)-dependent dehydrogenase (short-subunit alcohol dehydrogenase family)